MILFIFRSICFSRYTRQTLFYTVDEDGIIYTLDGSQRTSACIDYVNNKFALGKDTPKITIQSKENGEVTLKEYEIAGKKFKKLDEEVRSTLLACSMEFCTLSDYTDDEVKETFRRQNSSKPLNGKLLRIIRESDAFSNAVYALANHPFMDKLMTKTQRKNGTDRDLIIQTFMLILTDQNHDYTSFRSRDIDVFVMEHSDECLSKANTLKDTMDSFDSAFETIKISVTSIPMILQAGYSVKKGKKSFSKLVEIINKFLNEYDANEEYKKFVQSGTAASENVGGRLNYWKGLTKAI